MADSYLTLERPEEVVATVQRMRDPSQGRRMLAASYAHLGMLERAGAEVRAILELQPGFTVADWASRPPYKNRGRLQYFLVGLRLAGVPEE